MTLSALIHKNKSGNTATLTVATIATHGTETPSIVAKVASVTVANPEIQNHVIVEMPGSQPIESKPEQVSDAVFFADDRRHCSTCSNLSAGRCLAAWRGEIVAARQYRPIDDSPRRCEGYMPKANDPDQRTGKQRWPGGVAVESNG